MVFELLRFHSTKWSVGDDFECKFVILQHITDLSEERPLLQLKYGYLYLSVLQDNVMQPSVVNRRFGKKIHLNIQGG
jgi:hypothetical protein